MLRGTPTVYFIRENPMAKKTSEPLVVQSKVKAFIKKNKMNCSGDVFNALTAIIENTVNDGVRRAKSNGRKTLRADDL